MNTEELYKMFETEETKREDVKKMSNSSDKEEILKLQVGGTYQLRFIPNIAERQFFEEYQDLAFNSRSTGGYVFLGLSPTSTSLGSDRVKNDIVSKTQWASYSAVKDHPDKNVRLEPMALLGKTKRVVNVYIVSDSKNPENNGKNKALRIVAGENKKTGEPQGQIWKALHERLSGDKKDRFGPKRMFSLGENGVTVEITVKEKSIGTKKIPDYVVDFIPDSDMPLKLTEDEQTKILEQTYNLKEFIPELKSQSELKELLDEHWTCSGKAGSHSHDEEEDHTQSESESTPTSWDEDDDIPKF